MAESYFEAKFREFNSKKVMIVGDVMLDAYLHGKVDRISPEAPVPVVHVTKKEFKSGGASNVAMNIIALGAQAHLCSVVGADSEGAKLRGILNNKGVNCTGLFEHTDRPTTVKTRILSQGQQILRVDNEEIHPISKDAQEQLLNHIESHIREMDLVIIEDYNKGLLTASMIANVIKLCNDNNVWVSVDPKKDNFFAYKNVGLFKPNRKEIIDGLKINDSLKSEESIKQAIYQLQEKLSCESIMITLSEDGVVVFHEDQFTFIPAHKRKIFDVSGAGDTVISVASLCRSVGMNMKEVAGISNIAGGLVCEKPGVVQVDKEELLTEVQKLSL
jgi:D-glycero-beta-D-manno-heptose-7-phosphate kinase